MATKKIILDFRNNPIVGSEFTYDIYINGVKLTYINTLNAVNINYKSGGNNNPLQIGLGVDMDTTIDNTLSFLSSGYQANSSAGGYLTTISYARVGDTIEVTVNSTAPTSDKITFFRISSNDENIRMRAESPCDYAFISNQSIGDANFEVLSDIVVSAIYTIKNNTLNTSVSQVIPNTIESRLARGYNYSIITSDYSLLMTFDIPASITQANTNIYFSNNDLYVNVVGTIGLITFDYSIDGTTYQTSNIFTALAEGNYTVYIRDSYGCAAENIVTRAQRRRLVHAR